MGWSLPRRFPRAGRAEGDEGFEVLGRAECVHPEAGRGRDSGGGDLPAGRNQPGDVIRFADLRFNWKKKYEGLLPAEMCRLKQLEDENAKLRKLVADLALDREMLQDVIRRPEGLRGAANL